MSRENAVAGLAELVDPELADWIRTQRRLPQFAWSTASRRRPRDRERNLLREQLGVEDDWPVFCEEFKQWVIEDHFCDGRPGARKGRRHLHRRTSRPMS